MEDKWQTFTVVVICAFLGWLVFHARGCSKDSEVEYSKRVEACLSAGKPTLECKELRDVRR